MKHLPSRLGALALLSTAFVSAASAQTASQSATTDATRAVESAHTDFKGRHLAPRGTFYLLSYVAVKTDTGVEGFDPGQEVRLVEVHRPTQTLVVTDGHAQVEVPPSKLTNDLDIAAAVRQKDEANQARVTAYIQSEQVAYNNAQRVAADATAKDLEHVRQVQQEQAAEVRKEEQTPVAQTSQPVEASYNEGNNGGYYNEGGYGYGSPYEYFVNGAATTTASQAHATAPAAAANPAATSGNKGIAAPAVPAASGPAK